MSSPQKPSTPPRAARYASTTPGSSARAQCSADPTDFALVKIHTAKCSICDKRNASDEMRRCKGCTWQICRPCQLEREQAGRSLAHGNLMTSTPTTSVRRRRLHPIGMLEVKDPEAEAALAKVKEEDREQSFGKKKAAKSKDAAAQEVTPPSSTERKRKARNLVSMEEICREFADEEEEVVPDSPLVGAGSKRRVTYNDTSSDLVQESSHKRARMEQLAVQSQKPVSAPAELDAAPLEKAVPAQAYTGPVPAPGIRPSQHPTHVGDQYNKVPYYQPNQPGHLGSQPGHLGSQPGHHRSTPTPYARPTKFPYGTPRKSAEKFMEGVREKTPPAEPTVHEPAPGNIRDLVDVEVRNLRYDVVLNQDQYNTLLGAMREAARKFGNDIVKQMPAGFRSMAKPGLDLSLDHLTEAQKQDVTALVQAQASRKLTEFAGEAEELASSYGTPQRERSTSTY